MACLPLARDTSCLGTSGEIQRLIVFSYGFSTSFAPRAWTLKSVHLRPAFDVMFDHTSASSYGNRIHWRQMLGQRLPVVAGVPGVEDLAARCAEVDTRGRPVV